MIEFVDALEDADFFYLITKFESGGDLFDFLLRNGDALTDEDILGLFFFICSTVCRIHDLGVCHLDISLENIFISSSGGLKLADFGVAKWHSGERQFICSAASRVGKPKYMAPEIVEGLEFDGFEADVYSLGVVLFCLLYCTHPYSSPIMEEVGYALISNGLVHDFLHINGFDNIRSQQAQTLLEAMLTVSEERSTIHSILLQMSRF